MSKEEYEAKKKAREEERKKEGETSRQGESTKKVIRWIIWLVIVGLIFRWIAGAVKKAAPQGEDFSQAVEVMNREHIDIGSEHPTYNSNPPTSGWHYPNTSRTGFFEDPVPDEYVIHNLEHGDIWIAYHPRVSAGVKSQLEDLEEQYRVISPREVNEFDVSLVAWGRVDGFNIEGEVLSESEIQRITDFIKRYDNKGPEKVRSASAVGGHGG